MRVVALASTALVVCATVAAAQDVAGHLAAGDAARCQRNAPQALMHYREALALDSTSYDANWKAARVLVDLGLLLPDARRRSATPCTPRPAPSPSGRCASTPTAPTGTTWWRSRSAAWR